MKRHSIGYMNLAVGDVLVNKQTGEASELIEKTPRYGFLSNGAKFALATDKIVGKSEWVAMAPPAVEDNWRRKKLNDLRDIRELVSEEIDRLSQGSQTMRWSKDDCEMFLSLSKKYD